MAIRAFVSSTYRDLKEHRAYVIERLLRSGIAVDPMEQWTAASDEPKELSQDRIRDCDVCILLVGFRRGHIPEGETLSITQMEYREALRREIDVLVFMAREEADWPPESITEMTNDPEMKRWRDELQEHLIVEFFTSSPESVDVDSALFRWLEKRADDQRRQIGRADEGVFSIEIRAYGNSEAILIAWRPEQPIADCLGFALYRKVLGTAGVTEEPVKTRLGFPGDTAASPGTPRPSTSQPIQTFRWTDRPAHDQETRYRVVPILGSPEALREMDDKQKSSGWTPWVSRRTNQTPGFRAFFNRGLAHSQTVMRELGENIAGNPIKLLQHLQDPKHPLRDPLGGELRRNLLQLLKGARRLDRRVYVALSDLDDAEVIEALKALGKNLYLILCSAKASATPKRRAGTAGINAAVRKDLASASVHVYDRLLGKPHSARHNFAVLCDRWGTPNQVWTGSTAWTTRAILLHLNNAILIDSLALARAYLDQWESLRDIGSGPNPKLARSASRPAQICLAGASVTVWNTPGKDKPDLRDASHVIRGAREGVLFVIRERRTPTPLLDDILRLGEDGLFVQGIIYQDTRGDATSVKVYNLPYRRINMGSIAAPIDSTIVVVDPFGPHPVVITGSHDLSPTVSTNDYSDLLIVENAPALAAEYAVHVIGLYDHYRFRAAMMHAKPVAIGLQPSDAWQKTYFEKVKLSEFNFLFGSLWPGL
jgi:hypothetical protein